MPSLPSNLVSEYGTARETNPDNGVTTVSLNVLDENDANRLIDEWGETFPYSAYPGFFVGVYLTRQEGVSYRTLTPFLPTLSESATYYRDFPEKRTDNPAYDTIIGLQVRFMEQIPTEKKQELKQKGTRYRNPKTGRFEKRPNPNRYTYRDKTGKFAKKPKRYNYRDKTGKFAKKPKRKR